VFDFIRPETKIINLIMSLFPTGVSQVFFQIFSYRFTNIAGIVVWTPYLMVLAGIIQIFLYWYASNKIYLM